MFGNEWYQNGDLKIIWDGVNTSSVGLGTLFVYIMEGYIVEINYLSLYFTQAEVK